MNRGRGGKSVRIARLVIPTMLVVLVPVLVTNCGYFFSSKDTWLHLTAGRYNRAVMNVAFTYHVESQLLMISAYTLGC